jgi:hypothetical protein
MARREKKEVKMYRFFSFCDFNGKPLYFNAEERRQILRNEGGFKDLGYEADSFTSIEDYFLNEDEEVTGRYSFNPFSGEFKIEKGSEDNSAMEKWVRGLDFRDIVPELIIKKIVHPSEIDPPQVTEDHINLLKKWASVRRSSLESTQDMIKYRVGLAYYSVFDLVKSYPCDFVSSRVYPKFWPKTGGPGWSIIRKSVMVDLSFGSVEEAYVSSFFDLWEGKNPFQSCIELWQTGLVPVTDGEIWFLVSRRGIEWRGD